jgi:hypothetical protein
MFEVCKARLLPIITLCAALLLAGCGEEGNRETPDADGGVVLVTVDALRPDLVSTFGGEIELPALDRLASSGTVYHEVLTVTPMTRPALATLLTGLAPTDHRVLDDVNDRLGPTWRTVAEVARDDDRATAAFVSTPMASWSSGLNRGFELFHGPDEVLIGPARYFPEPDPGVEVAETFATWLESLGTDRPFFAWVHLADLHGVASNTPTPGFRDYQDAVPNLDPAIASILYAVEARSMAGPVEILVVGTHGTLVHGEGAAPAASFWLSPETLRVPLIRARFEDGTAADGAGEDRGRRWLPDVHATLLEMVGGSREASKEGVPLSEPASRVAARERFAWTWATDDELAWPTLTAVETDGDIRVFTLDELTGETGGAADPVLEVARQRAAVPRDRRLTEETRNRIGEAGFALGDGEYRPPVPSGEERDTILRDLELLKHHFAEERARRAAKMTGRVLEQHPDNFAYLVYRFYLMVGAGETVASEPLQVDLLERFPLRQESLHWAAHRESLLDDPRRAEILFRAALEVGPAEAEIEYDLACALALQGETQAALDQLKVAIGAGYRNWQWIESDSDLVSVRADPDYAKLMRSHRP